MKSKTRNRGVSRLPLGGASIAAMVYGFLWAFMAILMMTIWPVVDSGGKDLSGLGTIGRWAAICAGMLMVLLLVDTVVELWAGGRRRKIRVAVNLVALGAQAAVLYGSLEMMRAGAA